VRHWDTWADGRNAVLYSAPIDANGRVSAAPVSLSGSLDGDVPSKPFGDREEFRFSPDGKTVVFSVRIAGKTEAWSTNFDLYSVPASGGTPKNLTADNKAWDTKGVFSPDGRTLAYLSMTRPGFEADRYHIVLLDLATGKKRNIAENWDRSPGSMQWTRRQVADRANAEDIGQHKLFAIDVASGKVTPLTNKGSIGGFDVRGDTVAFTQASLASGAQLYAMKLGAGNPVKLTDVNTDKLGDVRFGEYEQFSFKGANGDTVYGHVMKPWNYEPGKKYPVAFLVHGGPQGSFGNGWSYRWNPQVYAGAGYATVFIDFHGSTGYGQKFTDAISGDWGGKPLEDLKKGLAAAVAKYPWLDRSKACALGASYGGYMMNWIEGNWSDGFKCIVNHDGVFDTRGMAYSTEEQWFTDWENGGPTSRCRKSTSASTRSACEQVEDADAGGARRQGLPHSDRRRACRPSPPCSAAASRASCWCSRTRTTGCSSRPTRCCGTTRSSTGSTSTSSPELADPELKPADCAGFFSRRRAHQLLRC
jgi:dipeptidyl aminopeptidase/acylaminoacyl peptidase